MKKIYKYPIAVDDTQAVKMPEGAEILTVQLQGGFPCLWALVDTEKPIKEFYIKTFGTGHEVPETGYERKYIGTYQLEGGALVFHVFQTILK